jgi:hypothetical protein
MIVEVWSSRITDRTSFSFFVLPSSLLPAPSAPGSREAFSFANLTSQQYDCTQERHSHQTYARGSDYDAFFDEFSAMGNVLRQKGDGSIANGDSASMPGSGRSGPIKR